MRWIGVDLHKDYGYVSELSADGDSRGYRLPLPEGLAAFCDALEPSDQVIVEASTNSFAFAEAVGPKVARMVVTDAAQTRGVVTGAAMNDKKV